MGCLGPHAAADKSLSDVLSAYGSGFSKRTGRIDNTFMNNPSSDRADHHNSFESRAYPARLTGNRLPSRRIATRLSLAYSSTRAIRSMLRMYER